MPLYRKIFAGVVLLTSFPLLAQTTPPPDISGVYMVGHHVADLDLAIRYYDTIDFDLVDGPTDWQVDEALNQLGNTPGAQTRTAVMQVQSSVSDIPFTFVLRQYRNIWRQDWSKRNSWDLLGGHIDLTVDGSAADFLDTLDAAGLLVMPEVNGLPNPRQQAQAGFRRYAFVSDTDGYVIEIFGKPEPLPGEAAPVMVSNSTATPATMDRLGKQAGFNHVGLNIADAERGRKFYMQALGGDYAEIENPDSAQIVQNGWFPQAMTMDNLRIELLAFTANAGAAAPNMRFQDINANHVGMQVTDIDTTYARALANGATTVTPGGIMAYAGGRAVLIRDNDVGSYILLWQPGD